MCGPAFERIIQPLRQVQQRWSSTSIGLIGITPTFDAHAQSMYCTIATTVGIWRLPCEKWNVIRIACCTPQIDVRHTCIYMPEHTWG